MTKKELIAALNVSTIPDDAEIVFIDIYTGSHTGMPVD